MNFFQKIGALFFGEKVEESSSGPQASFGIPGMSPYESANQSTRRGLIPGAVPTDARRELTAAVRSELVRGSRYTTKSSGFTREIVGNMALYSVGDGLRVQSQCGDLTAAKAYVDYFKTWSRSCEITNRFSLEEIETMVCRAIDTDGEIFIHKTRDGNGRPTLQVLETHRISSTNGEGFTDGIKMDANGAPIAYRVKLDDGKTQDIDAKDMIHVFEPESISLVRNAPTIQHSLNHIRDEMELIALEKHAVKDGCDITRVIKTHAGTLDEEGDFNFSGNTAPDSTNPVTLQGITGGKVVALQPGEDLEPYVSQRPSPTFTGFLEHLRRDSALGVLPYEFTADSSAIGGAGVRLVTTKADRRFSWRQFILIRRFVEHVWFYVIGDAVSRKLLPNVPGWWNISVVTPRRVTVDAGREAQQNRADVETGLKTLTDHFEEMGADFDEEMERRAIDMRKIMDLATKYDIPVEMLWKPHRNRPQLFEGVEEPTVEDEPPKKGLTRQGE